MRSVEVPVGKQEGSAVSGSPKGGGTDDGNEK
jgi:hypothetical protein